ncbi:tetratricopeptide repeat protein [Mucilaginibacter daejeonensis]|uniref:tetratricopeptide repeat protein n=1 Tax=Mucilaginibacter daejeonensis TaxID=398049 RepID=UPI001D170312|nr:tetratricopeptide repeat protein [Mucilaginibacter daejeonensis]UEG52934.1 tetratricopeptide repeat protein [Mucilaginibacter daejeonensis]
MRSRYWGIVSLLLPLAATAQSGGSALPGRTPVNATDSIVVQQMYFEGMRKKTIEDLKGAGDMFARVLQLDAGNDAAMYQLSGLKKLQNDPTSARELLEKAVSIKPDNEWYWLALADSYEKSNDMPRLQRVLDELLRLGPGKPDYYFDKANAYYVEQKYNDALAVYDKLEQMTGLTDDLVANRQKVYLKLGNIDKAASELQGLIDRNPDQIRYYLLLGEIYNSNKFPDKALSILLKGEKARPDNGMVHLALAETYRSKNEIEASFKQLELAFASPDLDIDQKVRIVLGYMPRMGDPNAKASALRLSRILTTVHPNEAKAFAIYGDILAQSGNYKEAREAYKRSVQINGEIYQVHEQLVRLELADNALDEAIKDGDNALSLFPNQAWMNYMVGVAYLQKREAPKALSYLKNTVALQFDDKDLSAQAYAALGDCYHELKDNGRSDEAYTRSLTFNPDNAYTLNNYAYYLSIRGEELEKAAVMSKHSIDLQPNTASFEDTYAWILFRQKKYAEAKEWMEKALVHNKDKATQVEHYGDILFHLGDTEAALQNWKKAKQLGAASPLLDRKINEKKYFE